MILIPLLMLWPTLSQGQVQAQPAADPAAEPATPPAETQAPSGTLEDLASRRDPFKRPDLSQKVEKNVTELETFSTLEYKMVGVVAGGPRTRAMLLAPNGKTYFVKEGEKIGTQRGAIVKITAQGVLVRERVSSILGKEEVAITEIRLPTETAVSSVLSAETGRTDAEYAQTVESIKREEVKKAATAETAAPKTEKPVNPFNPTIPDATIDKKGD